MESHIETLDELVELMLLKYALYKEFPEEKEHIGRFEYGFEGVYIRSDRYQGEGSELYQRDICRYEVYVNNKRVKKGLC